MIEFNHGLLGSLSFLPSLLFSFLTWIGGRSESFMFIPPKVWKRIIAPITFCFSVLIISIITFQFNWMMFLSIPLYMMSASVGYGGDSLWTKLLRRSLWSLVRTAVSIIFAIYAGAWILFALQAVVGLIVTLVMGISNPLDAPEEEGFINFTSVLFVPFYLLVQ